MERVEMGKNGDGFIDRSRVRILLCDNDEKSSEEIFILLRKCSYQVTSVKSPRQVINALNAEGTDIDIILSEVDLPMSKGKKLLKYITRDKELRRIPVIMMSAQDEVAIVVKCLKLGAADYLVKPLRTNELLNLWTHMWRRRRILGLAEKNVLNYDLDLVVSDPSDANTNSTTLLSDDTDDKSRKSTNPETCVSTGQENEANASTNAAPIQTARGGPPEYRRDVEEPSGGRHGQRLPLPKLRIGESSAFFRYVKSAAAKRISPQHSKSLQNLTVAAARRITTDNRASTENPYQTNPNSPSKQHAPNDEFGHPHILATNDSPSDAFNRHPHSASFPYFVPGVMCQVAAMHPGGPHEINRTGSRSPMMSQVAAMLPGGPHETNRADYRSPMMIQVAAMRPSWPHEINHAGSRSPMMPPYPYYPFGICLQPGQIPGPPYPPPNRQCGPSGECGEKGGRVDRREAALMKFRRKRKERCFDKKIRYVNRKKLAERRPRLRGQFVSKVNGVTVDLNGQPGSAAEEEEEEDEEDYDDDDCSNVGFSPEDET